MEPSILYRKSSLYTEHNLAQYFLLGLASLSLTLPEQFERKVQSQPSPSSPLINETENERYLHFMLGLLTTSCKFNEILSDEKKKFDAVQTKSLDTAVSETSSNQPHHLLR